LLYEVQQWIEKQPSWLLIIDNVDNLKIFKTAYNDQDDSSDDETLQHNPELLRFVPKGNGTVLWTSRDNSILGLLVDFSRGVEINEMTNAEALKMFQTRIGGTIQEKPSDVEVELLDLLGNLPLAIAQAAAYIRTRRMPLKRYLMKLKESEERQSKLLSQEFQDVHRSGVPNSVMHTWLISMRQIGKENRHAETILNTIGFLDTQGLTLELLEAIVGEEIDDEEVAQAIDRLMHYSFLHVQKVVDEENLVYQEHRLVQLATRRALSTEQAHEFSGKAVTVMADLFPKGTHETWSACKTYLPHALKSIAWKDADGFNDQAPELLAKIGWYYWEQGQSEEAERLEEEVLAIRESTLGKRHPDTIRAMANLAATWRQQGRYGDAHNYEVEVLDLRKSVLGEHHPETINAMANLASSARQQGRTTEAEKLEIEVLDLRKGVLGDKHPDTINAMSNLAETWRQQGRYDEVEKLEVEVLEVRKAVLGEEHPDTIMAMGNLAVTYWQRGWASKSEELEVKVLELRKVVLGETHPDTIRAMANLAATWWLQDRYAEAEPLEVEVLRLRKIGIGEKHPDTIMAMANLAGTWRQQGKVDEAEKIELQVLDLRKSVLGAKHPSTIMAMANLAGTWQLQGRAAEAEKMEVEVLSLRRTVLGEKHPDTLNTMANLATMWRDAGRIDEAKELEAEEEVLRGSVQGESYPDPVDPGADSPEARQESMLSETDAKSDQLDVTASLPLRPKRKFMSKIRDKLKRK
jgi:tetratricopeptide (TPR) repeat protein